MEATILKDLSATYILNEDQINFFKKWFHQTQTSIVRGHSEIYECDHLSGGKAT